MYERFPRLAHVIFLTSAVARIVIRRPDIVISLQLGSASVASSIGAKLSGGTRRVVRLTGGGTESYRSEAYARRASWKGRLLARISVAGQTTLIAPATHLLEDFKEAFPQLDVGMRKVPNGVRSSYSVSETRTSDVIWYSRRGSERSVREFIQICRSLPEVRFSVMGASIEGAGENVINIGWVDNPEFEISKHRVLLNTSLTEGMPNTALQALSVGTRVVGFANAGLKELEHEFPEAVTTIRRGQLEDMTVALSEALQQPEIGRKPVMTIDDVFAEWRGLVEHD